MKRLIVLFLSLVLLSSCSYAQRDSVGRFEYSLPMKMSERPLSPAKGNAHKYYESETDTILLWVKSDIAWDESEKIVSQEALLDRIDNEEDEEIKMEFIPKPGMLICIRVSKMNNVFISQIAASAGDFSIFFTFSSQSNLDYPALTKLANSIVFK